MTNASSKDSVNGTGRCLSMGAVFVCDSAFHGITLLSIASFANATVSPTHIHLFQHHYRAPLPKKLVRFVEERGHGLDVRLIDTTFEETTKDRLRPVRPHVSDTTFAKPHALAVLADRYDYLLYADGDILFFDNADFYSLLGFDELCAGCLDFPTASSLHGSAAPEDRDEPATRRNYINAGLFIVNCRRFLESEFLLRYENSVKKHSLQCPYFHSECSLRDQCPLNMTIGEDVKLLRSTYNLQRWGIYTPQWHRAKARHYTGRDKFSEPRLHMTDRREHELVKRLRDSADLGGRGLALHDLGLTYRLNAVRRHRDVRRRAQLIAEIDRRTVAGQTR